MGARHSTYLVDADEPQPQQQDQIANQGHPAPTSGGPGRPPPLDLDAPPAPTVPATAAPRRRIPLCGAVDTVDGPTGNPVQPLSPWSPLSSLRSPVPSPAAGAVVDVWILAGQSNTVGDNSADGTPLPAAAQPLPGLVLMYDSAGAWRDAVPSVHAGIHGYSRQPSCGPDMAFARTLVSLGLSGRVGLVPAAKNATSLFQDWRPSGGGSGGGGDLYGSMIARTKAALATPLPGGGVCRLRGMIWIQGESDAQERVGPGPSEAYGSNLTAFLTAVRRDLSSYHAQLPILLGVMSVRKRENFPYIAAVRQAQLGLTLPGVVRVDMAGFEFFEQNGGYHIHLTKDGACALGAAMAHAYYASVVRAGLPRGPGEATTPAGAAPPLPLPPPPYVSTTRGACSGSGDGGSGGGSAGGDGSGGGGGAAAAAASADVAAGPAAGASAGAVSPDAAAGETATCGVGGGSGGGEGGLPAPLLVAEGVGCGGDTAAMVAGDNGGLGGGRDGGGGGGGQALEGVGQDGRPSEL
ncbi:hypothetical protein Agub_g7182 [Astrephomene gubernaculifera]|uniref:Sialate O-acetylesterase domain-containing protein n=1 Tax=Astrephomene gubernaculifera TaxID=47775 RepID=A0AAD3DPT1_9CHLO|nr:hypothetical protein Agub_g7182 [Astrephomene gubernaculifera]